MLLKRTSREISKDMFFSLRSRMIFWFGILFVSFIAVESILVVYGIPFTDYKSFFHSHIEQETFDSLNQIADIKKELSLAWLEERKNDIMLFSKNPVIRKNIEKLSSAVGKALGNPKDAFLWPELEQKPAFTALAEYCDLFKNAKPVYERIRIVESPTGRIIVSDGEAPSGEQTEFQQALSRAANFPGTHLTIVQERSSGEPVLIFSRRIRRVISTVDGWKDAVIEMTVKADDFFRPVLHTGKGLGRTYEALLVDEKGTILSSLKYPLPDGSRATPLGYRIGAEPARLAAQGREGSFISVDYRGEQVLAAYRHIPASPDTGLGLVVKMDMAEVDAIVMEGMRESVIIALAGLVLLLITAVILAQRFSKPVHELTRTAELIQAGDLGARVEESGGAEERFLIKQFNAMADTLEKRRKDLEAAYSELESFSYSISHDLRTPLRAIDGYTNIIMEDYPDVLQGEVKECFEKIIRAADRMGNLIDELLHLSVISKKALSHEKVDLSETAKGIAVELKASEPERQAEFVIEDGLTVTGDKVLLTDVMENLLGNGWKFSSKKRKTVIELGTAVVAGEKVFFVRDNGAGFDSRYAHKLFRPFQRLHAEADFPGTGIGLATTARILQKHGGRIWAESVLDRGATFFFTIGRI